MWISKLRIILLLAGIAAFFGLPGSTLGVSAWRDTVVTDGQRMGKITGKLVSSPLRARTKDWVVVGMAATLVGVSALQDEAIPSEITNLENAPNSVVDDIGHTFQQTSLFFGTAGAFYVGGLAADRPAWRRVGQELVVAFTVASIGTQLVKLTTGRARPDQHEGAGHFVGPTLDDQFHSFWSGDVTKAFVLASVLSAEAKHPAVTIALYGLATTTAYQRVHADRHWFSDVLSAALWSTAVGIGTVKVSEHVHATPTGFSATW